VIVGLADVAEEAVAVASDEEDVPAAAALVEEEESEVELLFLVVDCVLNVVDV